MSDEVSPVLAPSSGSAPPPPPPLPGSKNAIKVLTYKEQQDAEKAKAGNNMDNQQFANLPDKLLNTMKREKKPFTYTPLSVGDNGKLDLSQIKSPRMKKRLMANMKDDDEEASNSLEIESIDQSLKVAKNQQPEDKLLTPPSSSVTMPTTWLEQPNVHSTSASLFQPSLASESVEKNYPLMDSRIEHSAPSPPRRQTSLNAKDRTLSPPLWSDSLDGWAQQVAADTWPSQASSNAWSAFNPVDAQTQAQSRVYGSMPPRKINIAQELHQERNANLTPSRTAPVHDFNSVPSAWQSTTQTNPSYASSYSPMTTSVSSGASSTDRLKPRTHPMRVAFAEDEERAEPLQSKSFKILQKLTSGIEDELQNLRLLNEQVQAQANVNRAPYIPPPQQFNNHAEPPAYLGTLNHIEAPRVRGEMRIPVHVEQSHSSSSNSYSSNYANTPMSNLYDYSFSAPKTENFAPPPPLRYTGANIPSRSFRLLQMMTGEFDEPW